MKTKAALFCLSTLLTCFSMAHAEEQYLNETRSQRIALAIGINEYNTLSRLRSAVIDAGKISARLRAAGYDQVLVLSDAALGHPPTKKDIVDAMNALRMSLTVPVDELVFFFAGHGFETETDTILCPSDYIAEKSESFITLNSEIIAWTDSVNADKSYVLIDSCRSRTPAGKGVAATPLYSGTRGRNLMVLTAAAYDSGSYESTDGSGGYFTRVLLDSLDAGDPTVAGILKYITYNLPRITLAEMGISQIPGVSGSLNPATVFSPAVTKDSAVSRSELIVRTKPEGAAVRIGDTVVGTAPLVYSNAPAGTIRISVKLGELEAVKEVLVSPGAVITVDLELGLPSGKVFFAAPYALEEYAVDGGPSLSLRGQALAVIPAGRHHVRLVAEGSRLWTDWITVAANETIQVTPQFTYYGNVHIWLPPEARMHLYSMDGSASWLLEDETDLQYVPEGMYGGTTIDNRYESWKTEFLVTPGSTTLLAPKLTLTNLGLISRDLRIARDSLPAARKTRKTLDRAGWITTTAGLLFGLAAVFEYTQFRTAIERYREAPLGADFSALRSETIKTFQLSRIFGIASGALTAAGVIPLSAGPRPHRIEKRITQLEKNLDLVDE